MNQFYVKAKVLFGEDSLNALAEIKGKQALLVTDAVMVKIGAAAKVLEILEKNGVAYQVFDSVKPDPSVDVVAAGVKQMMQSPPDLVVALGGGSVIDAAKGMLYSLWQMEQEHGMPFQKPKFVAIPSTSGTGSEVTSFTVITMGKGKVALVDDWMIPDIAIVDPFFVKSVPPSVTADTGVDVLCHALEAYVSTKASDYTDALCEKVIKMVFDHLLDAYQDGQNTLAREKMHNASCMAGIAFTNASLGITHSLAHALGGVFHIPHGRANAILLPVIVGFNAQQSELAARKYAYVAQMLGLPAQTPQQGCQSLILAIQELKKLMNVPADIAATGVQAEAFEQELPHLAALALKDSCTATNPYQPTIQEFAELYCVAFGAK